MQTSTSVDSSTSTRATQCFGTRRAWRAGNPPFLKWSFLNVIPIWLVVHYILIPVSESRLFLTPYAVVLIPTLLYLIESGQRRQR